ncbi:hypothetical protein KBI31_00655 [Patescibacteria group bacterium]|nr:hypothetical protein [Patescibacteria group bacterium]HPD07803.1 hypothetical protein [bacterium]HRT11263.1 hypothetical protein [Patescibacteria group bacterium]HRU90071.1 hypothetical protein [Patescibacteria group bacterium]
MNNFFGQQLVRKKDLWSFPRIIRNILVALLIITIVIYIIFSLKKIFSPPRLKIISPQDNIATTERQILLSGQTDPEVQIDVNGEIIISDESGYFNRPINLHLGTNYLNIKAIKQYGGQTEITRQIILLH